MPNFCIRPRNYNDRLEAIRDVIAHAKNKGVEITENNPYTRYALLEWAHGEITRLRKKCGEMQS